MNYRLRMRVISYVMRPEWYRMAFADQGQLRNPRNVRPAKPPRGRMEDT